MAKTRKSITKRLKITKTGKILKRPSGLNHFLAKKSRSKQISKKDWEDISFPKQIKKIVNR